MTLDEWTLLTFGSLLAGVRFVWRHELLLAALSLDLFAVLFGGATALLPIFAKDILRVGAQGYGFLAAAPAGGAIITGLVMARLGTLKRQGLLVIVSIAVFGAATIAFGLSRVFWLSLLMLAITGAADTISTILRQTIRQLTTPDEMRGRMTAVGMLFFAGWSPGDVADPEFKFPSFDDLLKQGDTDGDGAISKEESVKTFLNGFFDNNDTDKDGKLTAVELTAGDALAAHARDRGPAAGHLSLAKLSQGTVCKILADHAVKPHKVRYYLEKRDPPFEPKMAEILCVYGQVAMLRAQGESGESQGRESGGEL